MKVAPLQQAQRQQSASSAALTSEKESLRKEVDNWKKRVTSLTASFNAVRFFKIAVQCSAVRSSEVL